MVLLVLLVVILVLLVVLLALPGIDTRYQKKLNSHQEKRYVPTKNNGSRRQVKQVVLLNAGCIFQKKGCSRQQGACVFCKMV